MTLDDLIAIYHTEFMSAVENGADDEDARRKGMTAVMLAMIPALQSAHGAGYHDALTGVDPFDSQAFCNRIIETILAGGDGK